MKTPYWRDGWFGRGDIQLTHEANYRRAAEELGIDLVRDPSWALEPKISARIAIIGMLRGWFTKKKLADYFNRSNDDPLNARRIVMDNAELIKGYHQAFLRALTVARSSTLVEKPQPAIETFVPDEPEVPALPAGVPDTVLLGVQEKLRQLGYYEVGDPDGVFGDRTKDAIMIFRRRNGFPLSTEIDDQLLAALGRAAPKSVARERAEAKPKDIADKTPAVKQTLRTRLAAIWGAVTSFVAWVASVIIERFREVWDYTENFRDVLMPLRSALLSKNLYRKRNLIERCV